MKNLNKIFPDMQKALKETREKQMREIINKEFPDAKTFTVSYNPSNNSWFIVGLTPEQEVHLKKLVV